jgi:hypothetical protein
MSLELITQLRDRIRSQDEVLSSVPEPLYKFLSESAPAELKQRRRRDEAVEAVFEHGAFMLSEEQKNSKFMKSLQFPMYWWTSRSASQARNSHVRETEIAIHASSEPQRL